MEQEEQRQQRQGPPHGSEEDAPSPKDIYLFIVILVGALLVTAVA